MSDYFSPPSTLRMSLSIFLTAITILWLNECWYVQFTIFLFKYNYSLFFSFSPVLLFLKSVSHGNLIHVNHSIENSMHDSNVQSSFVLLPYRDETQLYYHYWLFQYTTGQINQHQLFTIYDLLWTWSDSLKQGLVTGNPQILFVNPIYKFLYTNKANREREREKETKVTRRKADLYIINAPFHLWSIFYFSFIF